MTSTEIELYEDDDDTPALIADVRALDKLKPPAQPLVAREAGIRTHPNGIVEEYMREEY